MDNGKDDSLIEDHFQITSAETLIKTQNHQFLSRDPIPLRNALKNIEAHFRTVVSIVFGRAHKEAEFLDVIGTKVLRVFLLAIHLC
jgi:hypothetical protein